jgi:hypothetical protein
VTTRIRRAIAIAGLALLVSGVPAALRAQSTRQIKVALDVRQAGTQSREAVQGSGGVIITERGSPRASGRVGVESTERRVTRTTGVFTVVQDGGESTNLVASQVPYPQIAYYRDYLTGIAFKDVGTSLKVRATVLPGNQVRVWIAPTLSWFADGRSGVIEVSEASTEVIVTSGRPTVIGGTTQRLHELTRRILGAAASHTDTETETLMTLTATVQ